MGCGGWGRHILRDLRSLGCDVPVVVRSQASVGRARDGGATEIVESLDRLGEVQGVVIATPEPMHAAHIEEALALGVPVFCEKPLTVDPSSAARIASEAPGRIFVMDKWRYHPGVEALRDLVLSQEIGAAVSLRCTRLGWGVAHHTSDSIWHLVPHDIAISLEILGSLLKPRAAVAELVDGHVHGLRGVLGHAPWVAIDASSAHPIRRREIVLVCEGGVASLLSPSASEIGIADTIGGKTEMRRVGDELPLLRELRAFVEHLKGGPPPRSSAADGASIVAAVGRLRELAGLSPASAET